MFVKRKTLLQTLRPDDLALLESAPKRWKSLESPGAEDRITGDVMGWVNVICFNCVSLHVNLTLFYMIIFFVRCSLPSLFFHRVQVKPKKMESKEWNENVNTNLKNHHPREMLRRDGKHCKLECTPGPTYFISIFPHNETVGGRACRQSLQTVTTQASIKATERVSFSLWMHWILTWQGRQRKWTCSSSSRGGREGVLCSWQRNTEHVV